MRSRTSLLVALLAVGSLASGSSAAKLPCQLVVDAKGDATKFYIAPEGSAPNDPSTDIVSLDYATNAKQMTTVVRVDKLAKSTAPLAPYGYTWYAYFTVGTTEFYTQVATSPTGDTFSVGYINPDTGLRSSLTDGSATGVIDLAKNEIRTTFNLAQLAQFQTVKPKTKLTTLHGMSNRYYGRLTMLSDDAEGAKPYVAGTKNCVVPGK